MLPHVNVSMRGVSMPGVAVEGSPLAGLGLALAPALAVYALLAHVPWRRLAALAAALAVAAATANGLRVALDVPTFTGSNFKGGWTLTPEVSTILIGLIIYTTGFIAEIVRGGVLSIGKGRWEAGRSLGLSWGHIIRLVVVPQMLRVIVPPMNSQYINVVKNSTLAIAVGYPNFLAVMNTIINKTSHSIEGVFIILGAYLALNLTLSSVVNLYNRRIKIVER